MWFTIYETATGAIKGHQSIPAVDLPPEFSVREDAERQDQTNIWDAGVRAWIPRPVSRMSIPSHLVRQLTALELKALAEGTGPGVAAFLRALTILECRDQKINKDGPEANQLLKWLVDDGVLTTARKNALLS